MSDSDLQFNPDQPAHPEDPSLLGFQLESSATPEDIEFIDKLPSLIEKLKSEIAHVIVGQEEVINQVLITLLARGHALLEGVPGLAKTLLVSSVAEALSLKSGRIQFTPDLMPSDITGTLVVEEDPFSGKRDFVFREGPIFVNILLADEINRSPPKTQAALLEGMAEKTVTQAGKRYKLPKPFFVLATQNPIEQEGTYPLPEAQLDRFLLKIDLDYPELEDEAEILRRTTGKDLPTLDHVLSIDEVAALQRVVDALPVSNHVMHYATRLVRGSRPNEPGVFPWVKDLIAWGAGPRAVQALIRAGKAHTLLEGRYSVTRADIRQIAPAVLRHRILPSFQAEAEQISADEIVMRLLYYTEAFPDKATYDAATRKILRL